MRLRLIDRVRRFLRPGRGGARSPGTAGSGGPVNGSAASSYSSGRHRRDYLAPGQPGPAQPGQEPPWADWPGEPPAAGGRVSLRQPAGGVSPGRLAGRVPPSRPGTGHRRRGPRSRRPHRRHPRARHCPAARPAASRATRRPGRPVRIPRRVARPRHRPGPAGLLPRRVPRTPAAGPRTPAPGRGRLPPGRGRQPPGPGPDGQPLGPGRGIARQAGPDRAAIRPAPGQAAPGRAAPGAPGCRAGRSPAQARGPANIQPGPRRAGLVRGRVRPAGRGRLCRLRAAGTGAAPRMAGRRGTVRPRRPCGQPARPASARGSRTSWPPGWMRSTSVTAASRTWTTCPGCTVSRCRPAGRPGTRAPARTASARSSWARGRRRPRTSCATRSGTPSTTLTGSTAPGSRTRPSSASSTSAARTSLVSDFHKQAGELGRREFFADAFAAIASRQRPALVDMLGGNTRPASRCHALLQSPLRALE